MMERSNVVNRYRTDSPSLCSLQRYSTLEERVVQNGFKVALPVVYCTEEYVIAFVAAPIFELPVLVRQSPHMTPLVWESRTLQ